MRIERIDIDGFGRIAGASWTLPDGLTVFLGANEAGKSTLLNAVRALLFGFESTRNGRVWYPALAGGRRGGTLSIVDRDGARWVVERHGEGGGTGSLAVRAPSGNQGGTETLDRLLGGADRDLFRTIFAFGLSELSDASSMSGEGVRGRIYGAAAGLGGASAIGLEGDLRERLEALFKPSGQKPVINELFARMEELRARISTLERAPEEHAAAHRERDEARARAADLRSEADRLRERGIRLEQAEAAAPILAELRAAEERLGATDPTLDAVPPDAGAVADARLAAVETARVRLADLDRRLDDLDVDLAALTIDEPILAVAGELRALEADRLAIAGDDDRRADATAAVRRLDAAIGEAVARTRMAGEDALLALDDAIPILAEMEERERSLDDATARLDDAQRRVVALIDERTRSGGESERRADGSTLDLDAVADALRELSMRMGRAALPATLGGAAAAAAVIVVAGVVGALLGVMVSAAPVGLLIGAGCGLLAAMFLRAAAAGGAPDVTLLERAGLPPTASPADVERRRDEVAVERARRDRDAASERAAVVLDERIAEAERAVAVASDARSRAVEAWEDWLDRTGLSPGTAPSVARQTLAAAGAARRAAAERAEHRSALERLTARSTEFEARAEALLAALDMRRGSLAGRLAAALDRLERSAHAAEARASLDLQRTKLATQRPALEADVVAAEEALAMALEAIGVADAAGLRARVAAADERRAAAGAVRGARDRLLALAGSEPVAEELRSAGARLDLASVRAERASASARLDAVEEEERAAHARIGELSARIRELESSAELGSARQELATLEGQARATARTWATTALAACLLGETRHRYERERQPDVVRAAQGYFRRITDGRYERITAPPGDGTIRVETEGGEQLLPGELSRGTAEQLYLSLRFGLIEEFARHADPLPVVMDDILVNFDAARAERAAAAIRQLATSHQVVFFTCRAETARLLDPDGNRTRALARGPS